MWEEGLFLAFDVAQTHFFSFYLSTLFICLVFSLGIACCGFSRIIYGFHIPLMLFFLSFCLFFMSLLVYGRTDFIETPYLSLLIFKWSMFGKLVFILDGVSFLFLVLTSFLIPQCILIHVVCLYESGLHLGQPGELLSWVYNQQVFTSWNTKSFKFFFLLFFLHVVLFFFFTCTNVVIFYVLFEVSAIPMFLIIGLLGVRSNKVKAAYYLLCYTLVSSVPFLFGLFIFFYFFGSADMLFLSKVKIPFFLQKLLWPCFMLAFLVKVPVIPFHVWLPEAHVEASTEGSVLLAGLLLKLGFFGIVKFVFPFFPEATLYYNPAAIAIASVSATYASIIMFSQNDLKKIVAYFSIAHMNLSLLGLFSGTVAGVGGCFFMLFSHGFISSGLFTLIGFLYYKFHTRLLHFYGGLACLYPTSSLIFLVLLLGNFGMPLTSGFVGEFLIFVGLFERGLFAALIGLATAFISPILSLSLFNKVFGGPVSCAVRKVFVQARGFSFSETKIEVYTLVFFLFYTLFLGVFPRIILDSILYFTQALCFL